MNSEPMRRVLDALHYTGSRDSGNVQCHCPAHDDGRASLSVGMGDDGRVLLHCFAGCETGAILNAAGLTTRDLFPHQNGHSKPKTEPRIVAIYDYRDADGNLLYQTIRKEPGRDGTGKDFLQRRPDGNGSWIWKTRGMQTVLYRLPELLAADPAQPVYIVEGEKDTDRLRELGLIATSNVGGAGKWKPSYNDTLAGRQVIILPDNDAPGRKHANDIAGQLLGIAAQVKVVELPGLRPKGDVSDWLDAGGTLDELKATANAADSYTAEDSPQESPGRQAGSWVEKSDLATAEYAFALYGHELIHTTTHGYLRNAGTHWTTDKAEAHAQKRMNDALRQQAVSALGKGDTELLKRSIPDARNTRAVLYQFRSLVASSASDLDAEPHLLNVQNGVIDLRTGTLAAHEASNRFTYCLAADYNPGAHMRTRPLYSEKLSEWFNGDEETIAFMERALGYAITGETKEEIAVWLQGRRRSGKGSMLNTVLDLLGEPLGKTLSMRALTNERADPQGFAIAPLRPARFVVASESKKNQRIDAGLLKWITGRDTIQVAHKGKDPFQFRPQFKLFVMSNFLPSVDAADDAVHGRIKIVKMPNSYYGTEDRDLKDVLMSAEQRDLLLALLVAQAGNYYKLGLEVPGTIEDRAEEVRQANNPTWQWIGESVTRKRGHSELLDDWYQHYCAWCSEWGYEPQKKGWFARTLYEAGYETKREWDTDSRKKVQRVFDGVLDG